MILIQLKTQRKMKWRFFSLIVRLPILTCDRSSFLLCKTNSKKIPTKIPQTKIQRTPDPNIILIDQFSENNISVEPSVSLLCVLKLGGIECPVLGWDGVNFLSTTWNRALFGLSTKIMLITHWYFSCLVVEGLCYFSCSTSQQVHKKPEGSSVRTADPTWSKGPFPILPISPFHRTGGNWQRGTDHCWETGWALFSGCWAIDLWTNCFS